MNKKFTIISLLVFMVLGLSACSEYNVTATPTSIDPNLLFATALPTDPSETVVLYVILPNDSRVGFSYNDFEELPDAIITLGEQEYQGVRMLDILERSGGFNNMFSVTIEGKGSLTLPAREIAEDAILVLNNHGMIDFISPTVDFEDLPKDVLLITLK